MQEDCPLPCLVGFLSDSSREVFHLIPEKRLNFICLVREILGKSYLTVETLQRLAEKCIGIANVWQDGNKLKQFVCAFPTDLSKKRSFSE